MISTQKNECKIVCDYYKVKSDVRLRCLDDDQTNREREREKLEDFLEQGMEENM